MWAHMYAQVLVTSLFQDGRFGLPRLIETGCVDCEDPTTYAVLSPRTRDAESPVDFAVALCEYQYQWGLRGYTRSR